jgi:hypothetical protein
MRLALLSTTHSSTLALIELLIKLDVVRFAYPKDEALSLMKLLTLPIPAAAASRIVL